ncbi:hypothetical protein P879_09663 [Paragonimus westermani]|uniref:Uncharacterized protein n=1 Tax=Paragonimus westermani TaxID=34504 RepID=A0A8T0D5S3_9TREM|nr:hypothetical protein P879_09663 [Paragonimus westermani]
MPSEKPYDEAVDVQDSEDIVTPRSQNSSRKSMKDFVDRQLKSNNKPAQLASSSSVSVIRKLFQSIHIYICTNTILFFYVHIELCVKPYAVIEHH